MPRRRKAGTIADLIPDPGVTEVTKNMKEAGWTVRILVRYVLLQVPCTALLVLILIQLRNWFDLPAWSMWGLIAISVAKDVILFPFVWRAYDWNRQREAHSMVGRRGIAKERLALSGYIKIRGELWKARVVVLLLKKERLFWLKRCEALHYLYGPTKKKATSKLVAVRTSWAR